MKKKLMFNLLSHPNGEAALDAINESIRLKQVHLVECEIEGSALKDKKLNALEDYFLSLNLFKFDPLDTNMFWDFDQDDKTALVYESRMGEEKRDSEHRLVLADHPKIDQIKNEYNAMIDACRERAMNYNDTVIAPMHTKAWDMIYAILEDVGAISKGDRPALEIGGRMISFDSEADEPGGLASYFLNKLGLGK
jgi:hypothetical protein